MLRGGCPSEDTAEKRGGHGWLQALVLVPGGPRAMGTAKGGQASPRVQKEPQ